MKIIEDWRSAWKWFSMQSMAMTLVILGAWGAMPDDLKNALPGWLIPILAMGTLGLGILGRLVDQKKPGAE